MSTKKTEVQPVLHHYQIADGVVAFSSTRQGGVSEGNYAAFNVNHYCGDQPAHIAENRRLLCQLLGIDESHLVYPHQTHGTEIRQIDSRFMAMSTVERNDYLEGVDAVITDLQGVCIGVSTADCIPVLLYDEVHHAVAAIHAGWRGTVARIVEKTVATMQHVYQTDPRQLKAVIGPGISLKNFEVGDEVYEAFEQNGFPMHEIAQQFPTTNKVQSEIVNCKLSNRKWRWHINLPKCNRLQLVAAGLQNGKIHDTAICTYDEYREFFSARRLGVMSGRIYSAIIMP